MSSITKETVCYVADLARLYLTDEEIEQMTEALNKILEFEEQLNSVNTDNVEPMAHAVPLNNVMREDVVEESMPIREAMLNAPDEVEGFFRVPRIIEKD